ncbi:MAG: phage/conjugal plasmid C-4 type zinc finger TraR family protein [Sulfitobacter sp.]
MAGVQQGYILAPCNEKGHDMAGGWAKDGAVSEQIEASIRDELARMKARKQPQGDSLSLCAECEEAIPEARRIALPGVKLCIDCVRERDARVQQRGGINRRGSKDSQLK